MWREMRGLSAITLMLITAVVVAGVAFLLVPFELGGGTQSRGDFLAPLLSAAALLVSGFAVVASVRTAGSGFRAEEKVKEDIATLLTTLRNLRLRLRLRLSGFLEGVPGQRPLDLVAEQRRIIDAINNSTTGYALVVLEAERSRAAGAAPSDWRLLQLYLLELLEADEPAVVLNRALELEGLLETLTTHDIRRMAGYVSDLGESTTLFKNSHSVLDDVDKKPTDEEGVREQMSDPSSDALLGRFRQIKARGVDDPDLDMFIAVLEGDGSIDALKTALDRGANPNISDTELLRRYDEGGQ